MLKLEELEAKVNVLEARLQAAEDVEAIKKLQYAYGYYLEHWQEEELIGLFSHSDDITIEINDIGQFKGWNDVRECYRFEDHYPEYPGLTKAPPEFLHILMPIAFWYWIKEELSKRVITESSLPEATSTPDSMK